MAKRIRGLKDVNKIGKVEKKSTTKASKRNIDEELRAEYLSLAKLKEGSESKGGLTDINFADGPRVDQRRSDSYNKLGLKPKADKDTRNTALSKAEKYAREAEEELRARDPRDQPATKVFVSSKQTPGKVSGKSEVRDSDQNYQTRKEEKKEVQKYEDFMSPSQFFNPGNRDYNTGSAYQMKDESGTGFVNFEMDVDDSSDED